MTFKFNSASVASALIHTLVLVTCIPSATAVSFAASAMIRVGYPQPSGAMLPLWLVSEAKLDQKYGVPVQNIFISGASPKTISNRSWRFRTTPKPPAPIRKTSLTIALLKS